MNDPEPKPPIEIKSQYLDGEWCPVPVYLVEATLDQLTERLAGDLFTPPELLGIDFGIFCPRRSSETGHYVTPGEIIRRWRQDHGVSQEDMGRTLHYDQVQISHLELGQRRISPQLAVHLAQLENFPLTAVQLLMQQAAAEYDAWILRPLNERAWKSETEVDFLC